jgi:hypothetical protein
MPRCSRKESRHPPSCSCLVDAFRNFPAQTDFGPGCASPQCPVRSLDSITLHQFLAAIGRPEGLSDEEIQQAEISRDSPVFCALARRRKPADVTARAPRRRRA